VRHGARSCGACRPSREEAGLDQNTPLPGRASSERPAAEISAPPRTAPPAVEQAYEISTEQLLLIEARVANEKKSVGLAYLLWFFLGALGIHNFYLGKILLGLFELLGGIVAIGLLVTGALAGGAAGGLAFLGLLCLIVWGAAYIVDLFLIPRRVRLHSQRLRERYMSTLRSGNTK
jgi:hypothetical protein